MEKASGADIACTSSDLFGVEKRIGSTRNGRMKGCCVKKATWSHQGVAKKEKANQDQFVHHDIREARIFLFVVKYLKRCTYQSDLEGRLVDFKETRE